MLFLLCTLPVKAFDEDVWGLDTLYDATPAAAEEYVGESEPGEEAETLFSRLGEKLREKLEEQIRSELGFCAVLFSVVLLASVTELSDVSERTGKTVQLAAVLSVAASSVTELHSFSQDALTTLQELSDYSRSLLPVLTATASLSGAVASSAAKCAATSFVMDCLLSLGTGIIAPAICGYTALTLADAAVGNRTLHAASTMMRDICTLAMTALATAFTLWIGFIASVNGKAEVSGLRLTRTILSAGLPVVGKLMTDAAASLSAAAGVVRASAGAFGLAVVLSLCAGPFVRIGCRYLAFRLTACLCQSCGSGSISSLLDDLATAFGLLLALLGTGTLCLFMGMWSLMRVVL